MKKFRGVFLKNESEIEIMREAGHIVSQILEVIGNHIQVGIKTMELENIAQEMCNKFKVKPAFMGYGGFPFALCCCVNEEIIHGFPSERRLVEGDIVSCDMGVIYKKFYGDAARTFGVGKISEKATKLLEATRRSLELGIARAVAGNFLHDVSHAIESHALRSGYSVVKRFVGHGIGRNLHEKPEIPNFVPDLPGQGLPLKTGMVLAIEPMLCAGSADVEILADKWTAVTRDRKLSAHFENTVAITKTGPEILTASHG